MAKPESAAKELRKLEKRLAAARATESKRTAPAGLGREGAEAGRQAPAAGRRGRDRGRVAGREGRPA